MIKKRRGTYIQWNVTQPKKKNKIKPFAAVQTDLEIVTMSEVSQTQKDKYPGITYM